MIESARLFDLHAENALIIQMCEQSKKAGWKVCGMANQQTPLS